jgi:exosome complex exonuclease DIS3/RRP44
MLQSKAFVKKTKKGKILKVVREHYLRDDIWSGTSLDPECDPSAYKLSIEAKHYLVIDTNVALHQLDFLEHTALTDVIVSSVVLQEVQHKNQSAYQRLRALCASDSKRFYVFANENHRDTYVQSAAGESPNDRNDRAIRKVVQWYASRLQGKMPVILITNDADNRNRATSDGLTSLSVMAYARTRAADYPDLADIVAVNSSEGARGADGEASTSAPGGDAPAGAAAPASKTAARAAKRKRFYEPHVREERVLQEGLKTGRLHQGALRVSRYNPFEGWVSSDSVGQDILISGRAEINRAFDGDIVAVELLPEELWRAPNAKLPGGKAAAGDAAEAAEVGLWLLLLVAGELACVCPSVCLSVHCCSAAHTLCVVSVVLGVGVCGPGGGC